MESFSTGIVGNGAIPKLQLILHLRPPAFAPPTKRAALVDTGQWLNPFGNRRIFAIVPIFGRKHVCAQMVSSMFGSPGATSACDFYVGLIRGTRRTLALASTPVFEVNAGTALATPVGTPVSFSIDNPCADWLVLWADPAITASGGYTVIATD
jgi:hypothetical protein